jgi:hypothetical protein
MRSNLTLRLALKNFTKRLLAEQQRWAKIRLFAAAGLSIGDLLTDLLITSEYFVQAKESTHTPRWGVFSRIFPSS